MVIVLGTGVVAALVLRPDGLVAVLGTCLAALVIFSTVVAHVALPHCYDVWMPFLIALAAVGFTRLARAADRVHRGTHVARPVTGTVLRVVATAVALVAVVPAATIAAARPAGIALLGEALREHGMPADHRVLFVEYGSTWGVSFRGHASAKPEDGAFGAIAVGPDIRYPVSDEVQTSLSENRAALDHVRVDYLDVWILRDGARFVQHDGRFAVQPETARNRRRTPGDEACLLVSGSPTPATSRGAP